MNKLILLILCWLSLSAPLLADSSSCAKGVIILTSASGLDPRNVLFTDLIWTDFYGGNVIDTEGQKSVFAKKDIGKIVYFDSNYYVQVDNDPQEKAFRAGIQAREIVVNTSFLNLDAINNLKALQGGQTILESIVQEHPNLQSMVQPQIDQLKDDITKLSGGQSLLNGKWMSQQEAATQATPPVVGEANEPVTFTTKDGKKYVNAKVFVTDSGLSVLTSDGGASVHFDQLPNDLTIFPKRLQDQIAAKRNALAVQIQPSATNSALTSSSPAAVASEIKAGSTTSVLATSNAAPKLSPQVSGPPADALKANVVFPPLTKTEVDLYASFSDRAKKDYAYRSWHGNSWYYVPSFSDELPPPLGTDEPSLADTIRFINSKLRSFGSALYYDANYKHFVMGELGFTDSGRILVTNYHSIRFNPSDLNPEKIEKRTNSNGRMELVLYTTNNEETIEGLDFSGKLVKTYVLTVPVEDDHDAQSLCDAITHLIKLYGGKPEAF